jgi:hypothetical protein
MVITAVFVSASQHIANKHDDITALNLRKLSFKVDIN